MQPSTHLAIDPRLCGTPVSMAEGCASVELLTVPEMAADAHALVHGGFVFGLADYAAMLAINEPNVVLGSAEVRLTAPVAVGDALRADAKRVRIEDKKHMVEVTVLCARAKPRSSSASECVLSGTFVCFVPNAHVLDTKKTTP